LVHLFFVCIYVQHSALAEFFFSEIEYSTYTDKKKYIYSKVIHIYIKKYITKIGTQFVN